jgi:small nuclear ribonucleoprotein D2
LENVKEVSNNPSQNDYLEIAPLQMWTEIPKGKGKKPVNKDRFISKMFLR